MGVFNCVEPNQPQALVTGLAWVVDAVKFWVCRGPRVMDFRCILFETDDGHRADGIHMSREIETNLTKSNGQGNRLLREPVILVCSRALRGLELKIDANHSTGAFSRPTIFQAGH